MFEYRSLSFLLSKSLFFVTLNLNCLLVQLIKPILCQFRLLARLW